jgi:AcrR family transcriptional regulator
MKDLREKRKRNRELENKLFILDAAEKVFAKKGYTLATMDDIAGEVQFSKATLYRYFTSKRDIFMDIILNTFDEAHKNCIKIQEKKTPSEEKLRDLIKYILGYFNTKKNISRIFIMEQSAMKKLLKVDMIKHSWHSTAHPQVPQIFRKKLEETFNVMVMIVEEGIRSGEFREMDPKEVCYLLGALLRGFHFKGPIRETEYTLEESTDLIHGFMLHGIKKIRK